jgi:ADP-ribose pyrophosphatase YjhB (NUDIX family)
MDVRTTVRVAAYIIRKNRQGFHELLMFKHPDYAEAPIQIPGGGVEPEEAIECALHREISEECGLNNLPVIRKLGVAEICRRSPRKLVLRRHCFLLSAPQNTEDAWEHIVQGDGSDAGMCFSYFWHRPDRHFKLSASFGDFLHPEHIPELYTH